MSSRTSRVLEAFEALPEDNRRVFAADLLCGEIPFESGPLDDDEVAAAADRLLSSLP